MHGAGVIKINYPHFVCYYIAGIIFPTDDFPEFAENPQRIRAVEPGEPLNF